MRAAEIEDIAIESGTGLTDLCWAFQVLLPFLARMVERRNFIVRIFLKGFMAGIREFVAEKCGSGINPYAGNPPRRFSGRNAGDPRPRQF